MPKPDSKSRMSRIRAWVADFREARLRPSFPASPPASPRTRFGWLRLRLRLLIAVAVAIAALGGAWLWLRDSSLVAVRHVVITGAEGADSQQIRDALTAAARNMTTLDVQSGALRTVVAPYPVVEDLRVSASFPHTMRIRVIERLPVAAVTAGSRSIPVAGDGTLLRDLTVGPSLPKIVMPALPGGLRLTQPQARDEVTLLAAAPRRMLAYVTEVTTTATYGLVAQLRNGPSIYFGSAADLKDKWSAAIAVLADPGSAGAAYIDVTDPHRPAAGANGPPAEAAGATASQGAASGAASQTAGTASQTAGATGQASGMTEQSASQTSSSASQTAGAGGTVAPVGGAVGTAANP